MAELNAILDGVSQGLLNGLGAYNQARDRQRAERQQQAGLLHQGMEIGESGNVQFNPGMQKQMDYERSATDPTSPRSDRTRKLAQGLLEQANPQSSGLIQPEMSAKEIEGNTFIKEAIHGEYGKQNRAMSNERMMESNQLKREGLGLRADTQASHAADTVHNDKRVLTLTQQLDQLERGRGILDQSTITNQEFNDYQQEIQAAIAGASGGALGKLERTEYTTAKGELAALKQKITGQPTDAVPPEIVERLKALADHTREMMARHRTERAEGLRRKFRHNPAAESEMEKAIGTYKGAEAGKGLLPKAGTAATSPLEDAQAMEWARANPNDPRAQQILQLHQGK